MCGLYAQLHWKFPHHTNNTLVKLEQSFGTKYFEGLVKICLEWKEIVLTEHFIFSFILVVLILNLSLA